MNKIPTLIIIVIASITLWFYQDKAPEDSTSTILKAKTKAITDFFKDGEVPSKIVVEEDELLLSSTVNKQLQQKIEKLLRRFRTDYTAVVVIDNETGKILASTGYEGKTRQKNYYLPFSSTHPSASLFKIITSAKLFETNKVSPDTKFQYRGKGTTLYKSQLKDKSSRWTRILPFKKAFAFSNNVIFGKAALKNLTGIELFDMAYKFGFNRSLIEGIDLPKSIFQMPEGHYNMAELASGFNSETMISPLHAAILSMVVANDGRFKTPELFEFKTNQKQKQSELKKEDGLQHEWRVFSKSTANKMKTVMEETISRGTARKSFRRMNRKLKNKLEIGGKTGSLTGGMPDGKRDWFTSYAVPRMGESKGISVAVMNINVKKWYVRSAFLAKEIISYYFTEIKPIKNKKRDTLMAKNAHI